VPDAELEQLAPQVVRATVDGVATGVAAHDGDWVGFRGIEVDPAARRRGLGLAVMAALLDWGASAGATTAYLQVLDGNDPALALYARLGFATHHAYRYLAPS
jgi:GNAT superfamily N-acetyltransferase